MGVQNSTAVTSPSAPEHTKSCKPEKARKVKTPVDDPWKVGTRIEVYDNREKDWCPGLIYQNLDDKVKVQFKTSRCSGPTDVQENTFWKTTTFIRFQLLLPCWS